MVLFATLVACGSPSGPDRARTAGTVVSDGAPLASTRVVNFPTTTPSWQSERPTVRRAFPFLADEPNDVSVAVGDTSDGYLVNGHGLPLGAHHQVLPVQFQRDLGYGTEELIATLVGAAEDVAGNFPGTVLYLGNIGRQDGGDISWSVSHNNGRDADLAFFSTNPLGWQTRPPDLLHFDNTLRSRERYGFYRFDVPRNAALVKALFERPESTVQYLFMARALRAAVLDHLKAASADAARLRELAEAVSEPRGALPHDDHLHIRIFCSAEDVCGGCVNTGRLRPWAQDSAQNVASCVSRFVATTQRSDDASQRAMALRRLGLVDPQGQRAIIEAALADEDAGVRVAAVEVLSGLGRDEVKALIAHDRKESAPEVRCAVARGLGALGGSDAVTHLTDMVGLEIECAQDAGTLPLAVLAAQAVENSESAAPVAALIARLSDDRPAVRAAAALSLYKLTNRSDGVDWADGVADPHALETAREGWVEWHGRRGRAARTQWLVEGFKSAGFEVATLQAASVPALLDAIAGPPWVSYNAQRALMRIADTYPASLQWSMPDAAWYWTRYFKKRQAEFGLDLSSRPERPFQPEQTAGADQAEAAVAPEDGASD